MNESLPDLLAPSPPLTKAQIQMRREWARDLYGSLKARGMLFDHVIGGHCCLGRLCHLAGVEDSQMRDRSMPAYVGVDPIKLIGAVGDISAYGGWPESWHHMNDGTGAWTGNEWSHEEIALYLDLTCEEAERP